MSLILRYVNMTSLEVNVEEHVIDFIPVSDQTGKGLSNALLAELEALGLSINDCRGQGYDNGANMKGQNQGVQTHILRLNPRAYFMPCGCHNLNLTLGDMAKACHLLELYNDFIPYSQALLNGGKYSKQKSRISR